MAVNCGDGWHQNGSTVAVMMVVVVVSVVPTRGSIDGDFKQ